jgi:hypothetical protein
MTTFAALILTEELEGVEFISGDTEGTKGGLTTAVYLFLSAEG